MEQYIPKSALAAEIERRQKIHFNDYHINGNNSPADYGACNALTQILAFIDTLEVKEAEEPVSIWHDSNEEQPNFASTVATWSPKYKNGEIISRCTEVYSDRIWAYIDDLLKM